MSEVSFSKIVPNLGFTGERFIPGYGDVQIHMEHFQRYVAAAALVDGRSEVVDYGCGVGYGAHLLAQKAHRVLAVDIAEDTIRAARRSYQHENLKFQMVFSAEIPVPEGSVDIITCFEVIEHTSDQARLISEFERILKPDGLCIISSPERRMYSERTGYNNPFHVAELTFEELDDLLSRSFPVRLYYRQRCAAVSMFLRRGFKEGAPAAESVLQFQRRGDTMSWSGPKAEGASAMYHVAVCTKSLLPDVAFRLDQILVDENDASSGELLAARETAEGRVASLEQEIESARTVQTELKQLQQRVTKLDDSVADRDRRIGELQALEQRLTSSEGAIQAEVQQLQQRVTEQADSLADRDQRIGQLQATEQHLTASEDSLRTELHQLEQRVTELDDSVADRDRRIGELQAEEQRLTTSDGALQAEVQQLQQRVTEQADSLADRDQRIGELRVMEQRLTTSRGALQAELQQLRQRVTEQADSLADRNQRIDELRVVEKRLTASEEALQAELQRIQQCVTEQADSVAGRDQWIEELEAQVERIPAIELACDQARNVQAELQCRLAEAADLQAELQAKLDEQIELSRSSQASAMSKIETLGKRIEGLECNITERDARFAVKAEALGQVGQRLREREGALVFVEQSGSYRLARLVSRCIPSIFKKLYRGLRQRRLPGTGKGEAFSLLAEAGDTRFSFVISLSSYSKHLRALIESRLAETRPGDEVVLLNDHSSESQIQEIMNEYKYRPRIRAIFSEASVAADTESHAAEASSLPVPRSSPAHAARPKSLVSSPLVSVVMPIYDRTVELRESIESILNQSFQDFELLLICDGSPGSTIDIVYSYHNHPRVRIIRYLDNSGNACRGRNRGIKEARGEYVAFQDSDDIADSDRLRLSVEYLQMNGVDIVYGSWRALMDGTRQVDGLTNGQQMDSPDCDLQLLKEICVPAQSTVTVSTDALRRVGGLKRSMRYCEDYELWLRLAHHGYCFKSIRRVLTNLRFHNGNLERRFEGERKQWQKRALAEYTRPARLSPIVGYFIPTQGIGGGIANICQHCNRLLQAGLDVIMVTVNEHDTHQLDWFPKQKVPVIPLSHRPHVDVAVATGWSTAEDVVDYPSERRCYFVQSDESRFYPDDAKLIARALETYQLEMEYLTEAKWIQRWLRQEFGHEALLVPHGLEPSIHRPVEPLEPRCERVRVLLEGPIDIPFKGMADAFKAVHELDCEVWCVSTAGSPKPSWRCDRFFGAVPFVDMPRIYSSCDVLLKLSRVEGFFSPPMEMMACGGTVVVGDVTGCDEYIVDDYNGIVVPLGDISAARDAVRRLIDDPCLRSRLTQNGKQTAAQWRWEPTIDKLKSFYDPERIKTRRVRFDSISSEI